MKWTGSRSRHKTLQKEKIFKDRFTPTVQLMYPKFLVLRTRSLRCSPNQIALKFIFGWTGACYCRLRVHYQPVPCRSGSGLGPSHRISVRSLTMRNNWHSTNLLHFLHWREVLTAGERKKTLLKSSQPWKKDTEIEKEQLKSRKYLGKKSEQITVFCWKQGQKNSQISPSIWFTGNKLAIWQSSASFISQSNMLRTASHRPIVILFRAQSVLVFVFVALLRVQLQNQYWASVLSSKRLLVRTKDYLFRYKSSFTKDCLHPNKQSLLLAKDCLYLNEQFLVKRLLVSKEQLFRIHWSSVLMLKLRLIENTCFHLCPWCTINSHLSCGNSHSWCDTRWFRDLSSSGVFCCTAPRSRFNGLTPLARIS